MSKFFNIRQDISKYHLPFACMNTRAGLTISGDVNGYAGETLEGSGTRNNPWLIKTAVDLEWVADAVAMARPFKDNTWSWLRISVFPMAGRESDALRKARHLLTRA